MHKQFNLQQYQVSKSPNDFLDFSSCYCLISIAPNKPRCDPAIYLNVIKNNI